MRSAEEDSKSLRVMHARVNQLTAERASLTAGNEQAERRSLTIWLLVFADCKLL